MKITLNLKKSQEETQVNIFPCFSTNKKTTGNASPTISNSHWPNELTKTFNHSFASKNFKSEIGETLILTQSNGSDALIVGLGDKSKLTKEIIRRQIALIYKNISSKYIDATIHIDGFLFNPQKESVVNAMAESIFMTAYRFERHKSFKSKDILELIIFHSTENSSNAHKFLDAIDEAKIVGSCISLARDYVNEAPNFLHSEYYAKNIELDSKLLKNVKIKILGRKEIKKENMGMFLSVNAGSAYEPRLVHLTYTPSKVTSKTKHIALVGKGVTFDTGGYSLKPGTSMINMKYDMAGSATVYAAFKAAALLELPIKISCFLGITDNAVSSLATMPDSIVTARNGKTVKILNTDAEGRLVLGDVVNYACDYQPDAIIDVATLTGAVLVALGSEVCGLFSNNQKLAQTLLNSAKNVDEYMWQLPIIEEHKTDMKGTITDLKNIGSNGFGGSAKGAAFIENFVNEGIPWAHLDIAGIGDSQGHLSYCSAKGPSGLIIRTLIEYLKNS